MDERTFRLCRCIQRYKCICTYYILCLCVRAPQVSSSILYLLLSTDATHLQTAVQAARLCCWGILTTGNTHTFTHTPWTYRAHIHSSKSIFKINKPQQLKLEMFQKALLIVSYKTAVIQWKVAGCCFEQDVHLQDRSVCHSGFLSVFVLLPLAAFRLFHLSNVWLSPSSGINS